MWLLHGDALKRVDPVTQVRVIFAKTSPCGGSQPPCLPQFPRKIAFGPDGSLYLAADESVERLVPNFANPAILFNNDLGIADTFGLVTATPDVAGANPVIGTGGPRNLQLGLKIRF